MATAPPSWRRRRAGRGAEELRPRAGARSETAPDWINRGALLQDLGRHAEALESYDKALALSPLDPGIMVNRANALAMLARFAEAEQVYDQAIARDPKLAIAYSHKGLAVKHQGRFAEARKLMEQALAMQPDDHGTAFALAQLMLLTGDWRPAWPLFERRASLPRPAFAPLEAPRWQGQLPGDFRLVLLRNRASATPCISPAMPRCWPGAAMA